MRKRINNEEMMAPGMNLNDLEQYGCRNIETRIFPQSDGDILVRERSILAHGLGLTNLPRPDLDGSYRLLMKNDKTSPFFTCSSQAERNRWFETRRGLKDVRLCGFVSFIP